jgi:hypothetical protein
MSCPNEWHNKSTPLKIGGTVTNFKLRFTVNVETVKIQLPVVMSSIQGTMEPDRFIMIGSQLSSIKQNRILNEIVQAFTNQVKNGWKPKFVSHRKTFAHYYCFVLDDRLYSVLGLVPIMINIQVSQQTR